MNKMKGSMCGTWMLSGLLLGCVMKGLLEAARQYSLSGHKIIVLCLELSLEIYFRR